MPGIAFFDFDGTITTRDSMLELIKFHHGKRNFYVGLSVLSPWMMAMKFKIISNQKAKERLLTWFFKDYDIQTFSKICTAFAERRLPQIINRVAMEKISEHKKNGDEVVVVSASASNWIGSWCTQYDIAFLATELEVADGKLTGKLAGLNCNYNEKANRILQQYDLNNYSPVYGYGDTQGDKAMLQLATHAFFRTFS
ncbi:MAG: HAD-IB family hydrolase [Ginsengibacter sp.]